jgi:hypothetical protein
MSLAFIFKDNCWTMAPDYHPRDMSETDGARSDGHAQNQIKVRGSLSTVVQVMGICALGPPTG